MNTEICSSKNDISARQKEEGVGERERDREKNTDVHKLSAGNLHSSCIMIRDHKQESDNLKVKSQF